MSLGVPCTAVVDVSVEFDARHRCPFVKETDHGIVRVEWRTEFGETIELHALAELVAAGRDEEISHEQWTRDLAETVAGMSKVAGLKVTSRWETAGGNVVVGAELHGAA